MTNIGVVVLNYMTYKTTIDCIKTFENQNMEDVSVKIVVVDNCSSNESFEILKKRYKDDNLVTVIATDNNLGFANGYNAGYRKLQEYFEPDFVICSNSDILLDQPGLYKWVVTNMNKYQFSVLGPSIYSTKGKFYQNPVSNITTNQDELNKLYRKMQLSLLKIIAKMILHKKTKRNIDVDRWVNRNFEEVHLDLTLHGSFQIMSYKYFEYYSEPYDPGTFMYMEENILKLRCDSRNLCMVYSPEYKVLHLQAVSTNSVHGTSLKKDFLRTKNMLKSMRRYMSIASEKRGL